MIGFIGLGIMGSRMADNLVSNGFHLVVYNRTKEKAEVLLNKGAKWGETPREVAEHAEIVFTMLSTPQVVEQISSGEDGLLENMKKGTLWVDCSTVDPTFSRKMAVQAEKRGIRFLNAPVSGSKIPAEKGELIFLVGGNQKDLDEAAPMLKVMGKEILYQGEVGKGSAMKLLINLMLAQSMAAFAETISLGESMGLSKEMVLNILLDGPTTAPFLKGKREKILKNEFSADFPLEHMQKDLQLVSQTAYENNLAMPIANITKEAYALAKQYGLGKSDFSAIFTFFSNKEKQI